MNRVTLTLFIAMPAVSCFGQVFPQYQSSAALPNQISPDPPVEEAFIVNTQGTSIQPVTGLTLVGSVEVRCKANWNDAARFRTTWEPPGGWATGQRFCRSNVTALEGPNKNAGAGWVKLVQGGKTFVLLGCRATGGSILDQYRSWVRARVDVYTVSVSDTTTDCPLSGDVGTYY